MNGGHCQAAVGPGATGANCTDFWDCASSYCFYFSAAGTSYSQCATACSSTGQCPPSFACSDFNGGGVCLPVSEIFVYADGGPSFTIGTEAIGQSCTQPATNPANSTPCDSTFLCSSPGGTGTCIDSCGIDSDCQDSQTSNMGWVCATLNLTSGASLDACTPPLTNIGCTFDSDCVAALGSGATCALSGFCTANPVGAACSANTTCDHGVCLSGTCSRPCCNWWSCPSGETCGPVMDSQGDVFKACQPQIPDAGGLLPGNPCDTANPNACVTGLCFYNDPAVPGHAGFCSETCCRDADCPTGYTCELEDNGFPYPDAGSSGAMGYCILR